MVRRGSTVRVRQKGFQTAATAVFVVKLATSVRGRVSGYPRTMLKHSSPAVPRAARGPGISSHVAAQLIVTWSHCHRMDSEACFARLAGVFERFTRATSFHGRTHDVERSLDGAARPYVPVTASVAHARISLLE